MPILYIDFDGTLTNDRYWRSLPAEQNMQVQKLLFGDDRTLVHEWMRGKHTAETVNQYVAEQTGMPYEELWDVFVRDCNTMVIPEGLLETIHGLGSRYTVVLLTGNMDSFSRFTVPALQLKKYFDHISNSFYEGTHKTDHDGELFVEVAKRVGGMVTDSILIDDSPLCCSLLKQRGGTAYQTDSPQHTLTILQSL